MPVKAYRVQHKDGYGMFRDYKKGKFRPHCAALILPNLHERFEKEFPTPLDEGLLLANRLCAFPSLSNLMEWISVEEREVLKKNGYRFYELHLRKASKGLYNVMFYPQDVCQRYQIL